MSERGREGQREREGGGGGGGEGGKQGGGEGEVASIRATIFIRHL